MIANSKHFGNTFYEHEDQKKNIGLSSCKIMDGEDLSK